MQQELKIIFIEYRKSRKLHNKNSWNKFSNIFHRWRKANSGILDFHWSEDFDFSSKETDRVLTELNSIKPSKNSIDNFLLSMQVNENEVSNRMFYLKISPAIFAALIALTTSEPFFKGVSIGVTAFLGIGFLVEQYNLNIERSLNSEIKCILKKYSEKIR